MTISGCSRSRWNDHFHQKILTELTSFFLRCALAWRSARLTCKEIALAFGIEPRTLQSSSHQDT
eukprot:scaffold266_cov76-Skeletonema_menzelii.AAC.10